MPRVSEGVASHEQGPEVVDVARKEVKGALCGGAAVPAVSGDALVGVDGDLVETPGAVEVAPVPDAGALPLEHLADDVDDLHSV